MEQVFQTPAVIQGISTLKDKTVKFTTYVSLELPPEEMAKLFALEQKEGWFLFKENEITKDDIPLEPVPVTKTEKTPSERLRGVLYRIWEQQYPTEEQRIKFTSFAHYNNEMEKLIEHYKTKLN